MTRSEQIFAAFAQFHRANPRIWSLFVKYTTQAIEAGRASYSSACIFERIRWHVQVDTTSSDDLKLNNNFTAYYARLFHAAYPQYKDFFRNRKLISVAASVEDQQELLSPTDEEAEMALAEQLKTLL